MISQSGTGCGDPGGPPATRCVVTLLVLGGRPAEVGARVLGEERKLLNVSFPLHGNDLGGHSRLAPPLAKGGVRLPTKQKRTWAWSGLGPLVGPEVTGRSRCPAAGAVLPAGVPETS